MNQGNVYVPRIGTSRYTKISINKYKWHSEQIY